MRLREQPARSRFPSLLPGVVCKRRGLLCSSAFPRIGVKAKAVLYFNASAVCHAAAIKPSRPTCVPFLSAQTLSVLPLRLVHNIPGAKWSRMEWLGRTCMALGTRNMTRQSFYWEDWKVVQDLLQKAPP
jgi:hypothetical protein